MDIKETIQLLHDLTAELLADYVKDRNNTSEIAIQLNIAAVALLKVLDRL